MKKILTLIFFFGCFSSALIAQRTVTGKVTDALTGESLPSVSIVLDGTTKGTISDLDGNFSLNVPTEGGTLTFSFVGYVAQKVSIGNQSKFDIALISDSKVLDEVVAIGYETVNKRDVMGSVSSVNAKQLKDIPITNAAEALAGRLAGVQVTTTEGSPGADVVIRVRGGGSITQDNSPIYIVDGIQVENALSVISPQDIASIDVLKDASTTAIYGARGANGVVIITTKSGKKGRTSVTYNGSFGYRQIAKTMDVLDPYEFVQWQYERAWLNSDTATFNRTYGSTWDTLGVYKNYEPVNWQDKVFGGKAGYQNHNLSISGGSDKTTYSISLTRNDEAGIQIESGFVRNLLNMKFNHKASDRFQFGIGARYTNQTIKGIGTSSSGTRTTNRLRHAITYRPYLTTAEGENDEFFDEDLFLRSSQVTNPIVMAKAEYRRRYSNSLNLNGNFALNLTKNLVFRSTFGYDKGDQRNNVFYTKITGTARNFGSQPVATIGTQESETINNSNTLSYSTEIAKGHQISILVGQELYQTRFKQLGMETRYFPTDIDPEKALANMSLGSPPTGTSQPFPTSFESPFSRIFSYFGRVNYDFSKRFLASFSVRADRSSKFLYENGQLLFPSGNIAWRFSEEKFLKNNKVLTDGKLRMGFGTAGNNRIGDLLYRQLYGVTGLTAINHSVVPGFAPTALANPDLRWESTQSQNIGLDLGFFQNRIQLTVDAYQNKGNDLLLAVAIPPTSGYSSQLKNVGATSNKGLEIQLVGDIVKKKDFTWNSSFNISFNRNRVESLGGLTQQTRNSGWQGSDGADDYLVKVGEPVGLMYGFVTDGFYTTADFDYNATTKVYTLKTGVPSSVNFAGTLRPGSLKIKDINGDGLITTDGDRTVIGNATPNYIGGWNNQFMYKGFDLSVFVNFVVGNDIYNANNIEWTDGSFTNLNILAKMRDRYRYIDDKGNYVRDPEGLNALNANAKIWSPANANRFFVKSTDIEDGSFLRINNVTLGYTLPPALTQKVKIQSLRIFGTVNNLKVFTNYSGYDPEVTARNSDPLTPGVDFAAYPRARVFVAGVNATF
ncbi:MAG: TonB-dependent receptor [Saprospiraceae bacterium]|nr:TonB-dependent receptor [Saprospiraceae bacterium]